MTALVNLAGAVGLLLHVIDCQEALFGDQACSMCAPLHATSCKKTERHETRWCDGDPYSLALGRVRVAYRATGTTALAELVERHRRAVVADGTVGMRRGE